jgi:tRNA nucleotidyltransferase (CCA-adding enzyme)
MIEVLRKIRPSKEEKAKLEEITGRVLAEIEREARQIDERITALLLGSASRDTWLRYEKDLDIFVRFPLEYEKKDLENIITQIGKKVLAKAEKRYAEHPYIKGYYADFETEIVPCYAVHSARDLRSSVDRTPFHDEFVREHIKGKEDEVRLLKQFLKGIGCYGAEARVEGFSGYLCELLIIKYKTFEDLLKATANWGEGYLIDLNNTYDEATARKKFPSPLIFIDPVDKNRNVASALLDQKFYRFIFAAKEFLEHPNERFFFPRERTVNKDTLIKKFKQRNTEVVGIIFSKPSIVDDVLYPQLRKTLATLATLSEAKDFSIVDIDFFVSNRICIIIEFESIEIPNARLHIGPEVNTKHEKRFLEKYEDYEAKITEPFIKGERWCIFLERKYTNAKELLEEFLSQAKLEKKGVPRYIAQSLKKGFSIKVNEETFDKEFLPALQEYFDPVFPWER